MNRSQKLLVTVTKIMEDFDHYDLYHGTSKESATRLLKDGWKPNSYSSGSQQGQSKYLYMTNEPENARYYADDKDDGVVLHVKVPKTHVKVDPEDGVADTVHDELNRELPGNVVLHKLLDASHFKLTKH